MVIHHLRPKQCQTPKFLELPSSYELDHLEMSSGDSLSAAEVERTVHLRG